MLILGKVRLYSNEGQLCPAGLGKGLELGYVRFYGPLPFIDFTQRDEKRWCHQTDEVQKIYSLPCPGQGQVLLQDNLVGVGVGLGAGKHFI